ncbi:MAG TPA: ion transporter [Thermoanaerobaculia bacterium]|nr:ion transporter [Thermoanaerobaculia bacterium]
MANEASAKDLRHAPYLVFMLLLSIYAVAALALTTFIDLPSPTRTILGYADNAICILFFLDFLITLARSSNRSRYLLTWGWLDLLSSIPPLDALRWGRAARILRIFRVLRGIKATKVLTEFILYRRTQSAFLAALLVSLLLVVLSAAAVLQFETSPEANIRTPEDAIWWAIVTVTTVGYGDKFPLSTEGRFIAALLMTAGVGLFGTFSGFVAAWFLESPARQSAELDAIQRLSQEVNELREELRDLNRL